MIYYKRKNYKTKMAISDDKLKVFNLYKDIFELSLKDFTSTEIIFSKYKKHDFHIKTSSSIDSELISFYFPLKITINGFVKFSKNFKKRKILIGYDTFVLKTGDTNFDKKIITRESDFLFLTSLLSKHNRFLFKSIFKNASSIEINQKGIVIDFPLYFAVKVDLIKKYIDYIIEIFQYIDSSNFKRKLLNNIKEERNLKVIKNIIDCLGEHYQNDNEVSEFLEFLMHNKKENIQIIASRYLGDKGSNFGVKYLTSKAKINKNNIIQVVRNFKYNNYKKSADLLMSLFKKSSSIDLKFEILLTLKEFNTNDFVDFVSKEYLYKRNIHPEIKLSIADILINAGDKSIIPDLKNYLVEWNLNSKYKSKIFLELEEKLKAEMNRSVGNLSTTDNLNENGGVSFPLETKDGLLSIKK